MTLAAQDSKTLISIDATAVVAGMSMQVLMERAGMALAQKIAASVDKKQKILFLTGSGNNAGDGYVACRHLANKGYEVSILLTEQPSSETSKTNLKLLKHMNVAIREWEGDESLSPYDVLIDCLLGYNQNRAPEGAIGEATKLARESGKDVIACDIPTGINATTGEVYENHLPAKRTISFAAPKKAFEKEEAKKICGEITIIGIGIPGFIYRQNGLTQGSYLVEGEEQF